jgi:putative endonuclease
MTLSMFRVENARGGFVYILAGKSGVLYIGVTSQLNIRVLQHRHKLIDGFTKKYNVTRLVYFESFGDIRTAIAREKQIKGWRRARKIALIESKNPTWSDLAESFPKAPRRLVSTAAPSKS